MKAKKLITAVFALTFAVALIPGVPEMSFAAGTETSPEADDVKYYTTIKDGKTVNTGIRSIVISPNTYTNISRDSYLNPAAADGSTAPTIRLNDATMEKIAKKYIFPKWGAVAEGIFRNQAGQLVTIEGSGMMNSDTSKSESFDRHFSYGRSGVDTKYKKYDWALTDLASTLGAPPSKSGKTSTEMGEFSVLQGEVNDDEVVYSGIYPIKNLGEARTLMGKSLRACSDDDNLTVDDFLANDKDKSKKEYRLPDLANDKTGKGFCSIVTCVNRADVSYDYDYNSFGVAVYDIDVTPIAASNVKYITAAQEYAGLENPLEEARKAGVKGVYYDSSSSSARTNLIKNNSPQSSTNTVSLAQNVSEQTSATTQETFTFGMDQTIGADFRFGENTAFFAVTGKIQKTFRETWASMKSNGQSRTDQENRTITTQVSLPGHTGAAINQNIEEIVAEEDYQQPVVINYKVAIFAMSGDYFNGSLGVGMISSSRYDKEWMSVIFDGSDAAEQNGCKALSSLYNRAVTNMGVSGYDGVHGKYRTWCDKGAWSESTKIDWTQIAEDIRTDKRSSHVLTDDYVEPDPYANLIKTMASNLQFAETATTFHVDSNAMLTSVGEVVPLYDLKSVDIKTGSRNYDIKSGQAEVQNLYLDSIKLEGYDKDEVPFYGFDTVKGKWVISEVNGETAQNPTQATGIELVEDSALGQIAKVKLDAENNATFTLKWKPNTDQQIISDQSKTGMSVEDIEAITTPQIRVNALATTANVETVNLTGVYAGMYENDVNLNSVLNVNVTGNNSALRVPIYWQSDGSKGIKVNENGVTSFTVPGKYNVRTFCLNNGVPITSNWLEITATEKPSLKSIGMDVSGLNDEARTLNENNKVRNYDLNSFLTYYDQFGNKWEGTSEESLPQATFSVEGQNASSTQVDSNGFLIVRKGGTYKVTAKVTDESSGKSMSASANISITEDPWLSEIKFNRPDVGRNDLVLNDPKDQIKIGNLKGLLEYYDQNGYEWTGPLPRATFKIAEETNGAEITAGGNYTFFAYEPGGYTIQPEISGYDVESVHLDVAGNKDLVIKTANPSRQKLIEGERIELELERFLNGTTTFGEAWKGDLPEMYFTLDEGVTGASVKTETIYDPKTGESVEIHKFITDTPGEYSIHVKPKQASAYTSSIDDIIVNAVSYDKVTRLGLLDIDEKTLGKDLYVNAYEEKYPVISLSQFVQYFDQNGDVTDPTRPDVISPEIAFSLLKYELDQNNNLVEKEVDPSDATLADGVLTVYSGGQYVVRVTSPGHTDIVPAETSVIVPDITWMHTFGDWEVTESTCTNAGTRTKTCQDANCVICKKKGEGYHETITDSIPATGHHWNNEYEYYDNDNGTRYVAIKCIDCGAIRPATKINLTSTQYIDGGYKDHPEWNTTKSTCEEDGRLVIKDNTMGGTERAFYVTPATGHHWGTGYVSDDAHKASCNKKGLEWIECVDCHAVKPGSERAVSAMVDEYPTNDDGTTKWDTVVEPKCDEDGYKEVKCIHCANVWKVTTPALGHTWSEEYFSDDEHAATCSKEGTEWRKCTVCNKPMVGSERAVPKTDHVYPKDSTTGEIQWETVVKPKCDEAGYQEVKCVHCENVHREELPATGHTMAKTEAVPATCTESGAAEHYTCTVCERFYSDEGGKNEIEKDSWLIPALGHNYEAVAGTAVPATCTEDGKEADQKCSRCNDVKEGAKVDKLGHEYSAWTSLDADQHQKVCAHDATHVVKAPHEWDAGVVTKDATCEEDGVKTYTCSTCGAKKTETIPALGHEYGEWTEVKPSTCVQRGQEVRVCKHDAGHKEYRYAGLLLHDLTKTAAKAATCTKEGNREHYTCSVCAGVFADAEGKEQINPEDVTVPKLGHQYQAIAGTATSATCTEAGKEADQECARCHDVKEGAKIDPLGHMYSAWTALDANRHQRVCSRDSHVEVAGHNWDAGEVTLEATPSSTGIRTFTCAACGATRTETIDMTPKMENTLEVRGKTVTVKGSSKGKAGKLKKTKSVKVSKAIKFVDEGQGELTYAKKSGNKKITISKTTGKIKVKKGLKKGTYKVKVKVKAAGDENYEESETMTVTFKVKVK